MARSRKREPDAAAGSDNEPSSPPGERASKRTKRSQDSQSNATDKAPSSTRKRKTQEQKEQEILAKELKTAKKKRLEEFKASITPWEVVQGFKFPKTMPVSFVELTFKHV
jgi:hypothetical protein